jgi:hypothetical protein
MTSEASATIHGSKVSMSAKGTRPLRVHTLSDQWFRVR